ncbi:MAG: neutral zinc metallopeptidase [Mycobacterium sp.]
MAAVLVVTATALIACSGTVVGGRATSLLFDPERAGGLPAKQGPSGPRPDAQGPVGTVSDTDDGPIDQLALLAVNDIEDFWSTNYDRYLARDFKPVETLVSYDSTDPNGPSVCGWVRYQSPNASYCYLDDVMAWDRRVFMPVAQKHFGDMAVVGVMAHEYGHALQWMSGLVKLSTPTLVKEQQADCFAGVYLRWVAAGESPRFTLSTADGLNHVLAGIIYSRDELSSSPPDDAHGSALDRVSAFQMGFSGGADQCAAIDVEEIGRRQGDLPLSLSDEDAEQSVDVPIDMTILSSLMYVLDKTFRLDAPPSLTDEGAPCADAETTDPVSYCPDSNAIHVDLPALAAAGEPKDERDGVLIQGDNTALSMVTSRYALAVQHERGLALDTVVAAIRTACLTGVAQGAMTNPDAALRLSPGDTDEAVSGLLSTGLAASDVNGSVVPAGFTRILAYRQGLSGSTDGCFEQFG